MKNLLLIIAFLFSSQFAQAQEIPAQVHEDSIDAFFNTYYEGGVRDFLEHFYKNINYPKSARKNCTSGILIIKLSFGENGTISKLQYFNPLCSGIESETSRVLNKSKAGWKASAKGKSITFSLGFMMGEKEKLDSYITVIADEVDGQRCYTTKDFQRKLDKAIKKGKDEKALAYCVEILKRNPWSAEHLKLYEALVKKLGL
jgi:hypothetical protein